MELPLPSAKKIRVLIVDDHPMMRSAMRLTLESEANMEIIGEAKDGAQAVEIAKTADPDLVVLDLYLPADYDGVMVAQAILKDNPSTRIMIITSSTDDEQVLRALQAGVLGYMHKGVTSNEFIECVRQVSQGNLFLQSETIKRISNFLSSHTATPKTTQEDVPSQKTVAPQNVFDKLTPGEKKVLSLIVQGRSNKEIALELDLSINTVTSHLQHIFMKMGFESRVKAVLFCIQNGFQ
jgi:DNA-binding NarL/FixJ family response regulator